MYNKGDKQQGTQNIGIGWEDPAVIRHSDGSIEFELGRKVNAKDLIIEYYCLDETYTYSPLVIDNDKIVEKLIRFLLLVI